jgi:hypothetical protein
LAALRGTLRRPRPARAAQGTVERHGRSGRRADEAPSAGLCPRA